MLIDVDFVKLSLIDMIKELNEKIDKSSSWSIDYLSGMRRGVINVYLMLDRMSITTKEKDS